MSIRTACKYAAVLSIVVIVAGQTALKAQTESPITALSPCVQELKVPRFGLAAFSAGSSQEPVVSIAEIGSGGRLTRVQFRNGNRDHREEIEYYLRMSTFNPSCAGRRVQILFSFRIEGPEMAHHVSWIEFKPPNHFVIYTNPVRAVIDTFK